MLPPEEQQRPPGAMPLGPEQIMRRRQVADALGGSSGQPQQPMTSWAQPIAAAVHGVGSRYDDDVRQARAAGLPDPPTPVQQLSKFLGFGQQGQRQPPAPMAGPQPQPMSDMGQPGAMVPLGPNAASSQAGGPAQYPDWMSSGWFS